MATTTHESVSKTDLFELDDEWTEEQKAIIDTCRRFVDDEVMPDINKYHQVEDLQPGIYEKIGALGILEMLAAGELDPTLPDTIEWVKVSGVAWHGDGFYYSRYPAPDKGREKASINENHQVYFHRVGTPQSADVLVYEDRGNPQRFHTVSTTEDERFAVLTISERGKGKDGNALYVRDLALAGATFVSLIPTIGDDSYTVVENVGGAPMAQTVRLLGFGGKLALVGLLAGVDGVLPIPSVLFKRLTIQGILVSDTSPAQAQADWTNIVATLGAVDARPVIDRQYPLADFRAAFDRLIASPFGKVVVQIK